MIIGSSFELPVGSLQHGIDEHVDQPFVVLREATHQEWKAEHERKIGRKLMPWEERFNDRIKFCYEVSAD